MQEAEQFVSVLEADPQSTPEKVMERVHGNLAANARKAKEASAKKR